MEQLQSGIIDAKALQLEILQRNLSLARLQAHEDKDESEDDGGEFRSRGTLRS
jgi:hypothetical protein